MVALSINFTTFAVEKVVKKTMVKFDSISKFSLKYELLYHYVRFAHNLIFYRKYSVENADRIPKGVPVVAICNHQNGLSDALGILFAFNKDGRRPVFIARADIFRKDLWAKLLRFLKIMPAFRASDKWAGGKLSENDTIFNFSAEILAKEDKVICLFPEAGHQDKHTLGTFKKGFARIAFKAAEMTDFEKPIYILPMGNHYSNYFAFQSKLLINIGEPFEFSDLYPIYKEYPEKAQKMLADRARPIVEKLMLNISDLEHYEEYEMACKMYAKDEVFKENKKIQNFKNEFDADKKIVASIDKLKEENPDKFNSLMKKLFKYIRFLDKLHLRDWIFRQKITILNTFARFLFGIILLPFIIFGFVVNFIPFNASTFITRRIKDPMLHSSFHIVAGMLFTFPLWYILCFIALLIWCSHWWIAVGYVVLLPVSLLIYYRGKVLWLKLYNRLRRFQFWFKGNCYFNEAINLRKDIVKELNQIVK